MVITNLIIQSHFYHNPMNIISASDVYVNRTPLEQQARTDKKIQYQLAHHYRESRSNSPGWNTVKEMPWLILQSAFTAQNAVAQFALHSVIACTVAIPAAVVGGFTGAMMNAANTLLGREHTKSIADYSISFAKHSSHFCYQKGFIFKALAMPLLTFTGQSTAMQQLLRTSAVGLLIKHAAKIGVISAVISLASMPLIYRDFAYNQSKNVEKLDYMLMMPLSTRIDAIWEQALNMDAKEMVQFVKEQFIKLFEMLYPSDPVG